MASRKHLRKTWAHLTGVATLPCWRASPEGANASCCLLFWCGNGNSSLISTSHKEPWETILRKLSSQKRFLELSRACSNSHWSPWMREPHFPLPCLSYLIKSVFQSKGFNITPKLKFMRPPTQKEREERTRESDDRVTLTHPVLGAGHVRAHPRAGGSMCELEGPPPLAPHTLAG